jgi:preprotein translocase SecF subunit
MRIFENLNVDFLGKRKIFYMVSGAIFLIGLINILVRGLEFGIDFNGGTEIVLEFEKPVDVAEMRTYVKDIGLGNLEIKTFGGETGILVRTELQQIPPELKPRIVANIEKEINTLYPGLSAVITDSNQTSITYMFPSSDTASVISTRLNEAGLKNVPFSEELGNKAVTFSIGMSDWIKEVLKEKVTDNSFKVLREDHVGPKIGDELKQDAVIAIGMSLLVILLYLAFRFKFIFAFSAVVALFHDVLITLGLYSLLFDVIPGLNLEIDVAIVGAFLTLVGYSINDTVVVFDRVRENLKIHKTLPLEEIMKRSLNKTMSRTVLTGGATILSCLVLVIFGGEVLRAFAFTLFFGIVIGTYSSIFVASALVLEYAKRARKRVQF